MGRTLRNKENINPDALVGGPSEPPSQRKGLQRTASQRTASQRAASQRKAPQRKAPQRKAQVLVSLLPRYLLTDFIFVLCRITILAPMLEISASRRFSNGVLRCSIESRNIKPRFALFPCYLFITDFICIISRLTHLLKIRVSRRFSNRLSMKKRRRM
jgi:hypothetical protein